METQDCTGALLSSLMVPSRHQPEDRTRQATYVQRKIVVLSSNHCGRGKAMSITHSECLSVALFNKHAKSMRRTILSFLACLTVPYFLTLSHKRHKR
jgi:hypothetical protein